MLRTFAPRVDLIAPGDLGVLEDRHIRDCVRAAPLVHRSPPGPCIDVGSGAGLPGIPLAIVTPPRFWRLLEPRRRRAAFLDEVVRTLALDCEVVTRRAEEAVRDPGLAGAHAVATARAVAPPAKAFELALPLVARGGCALVWLGAGAQPPAKATLWGASLATMTPRR